MNSTCKIIVAISMVVIILVLYSMMKRPDHFTQLGYDMKPSQLEFNPFNDRYRYGEDPQNFHPIAYTFTDGKYGQPVYNGQD